MKKFVEGLLFGAGFGISFVLIWFLFAFLSPMIFSSRLEAMSRHASEGLGSRPQESVSHRDWPAEHEPDFSKMSPDELIKNSTVIALAKYQPGAGGKVKAVITEFLKKDPGVEIYYKPGDEYADAGYTPEAGTTYGDGIVIFFTGSPASMRMSMSYQGDRIRGLGDLPMELFRQKCAAPGA